MEELKKLTTRVAHVLPVSDDGGSTAEIVRVLGKFHQYMFSFLFFLFFFTISISTGGAAMKAIINTEVVVNEIEIIKTPNRPM